MADTSVYIDFDLYYTISMSSPSTFEGTRLKVLKKSLKYSVSQLLMVVVSIAAYSTSLAYIWGNINPLPSYSPVPLLISLALLYFSASICLYAYSTPRKAIPKQYTRRLYSQIPILLYAIAIAFPMICTLSVSLPSNVFEYSPIATLIMDAAGQSQNWAEQASSSTTLKEAADTYRHRYSRHPPPGFDLWYDYAISKSSAIIDDFDSIHRDLLPFWALEPVEIRARTREILSDPWNQVAEVKIRTGKVYIGENVIGTHRWMLDGITAIVGNFGHMLPDMDLAFNINDESRVAVPYTELRELQEIGSRAGTLDGGVSDHYSEDGAMMWHLAETLVAAKYRKPPRPFQDHSFTGGANSFLTYGSVACPPESAARQTRIWDPRTHCTSCAAPHSVGHFLSNWTLAASPCHQPDLANLHGFYIGPSSFKAAHSLFPVFSQSKAHGFADILYPSPWNYIDKVIYSPDSTHPDPPFASKQNTLFWRGATSEGVSRFGSWKGMTRQRLVHLANNHTSPQTVFLPHPTLPQYHSYQTIPTSQFQSRLNLSIDIAIVDNITRCWDRDCEKQASEFSLAPATDFQSHWGYKYLLDMDGAGFSGRFLPFLQSRSLPFKSAIFREWYDDRLTAWRHFVPVDVRWQGLWSTLIYFSGSGSRKGRWAGVQGGGEDIAEAGREWVAKVVRKDDMEVYMFRLLLEWGRLTDDKRDGIGFGA